MSKYNLEKAKTELRIHKKGLPNIFLIDEYHEDLSIKENIFYAKLLKESENIRFIGIEGLISGVEYKEYKNFTKEFAMNQKILGNLSFFVKEMYKCQIPIVGVENEELIRKANDNKRKNKFSKDYRDPIHFCRTKYFIKNLFVEYRKRDFTSENVILNCGTHHNDDIQYLIIENKIDEVAEQEANYYRITALSHPYRE